MQFKMRDGGGGGGGGGLYHILSIAKDYCLEIA